MSWIARRCRFDDERVRGRRQAMLGSGLRQDRQRASLSSAQLHLTEQATKSRRRRPVRLLRQLTQDPREWRFAYG